MGNRWLSPVVAGLLGMAAAVVPSLAAGDAPPPSASFTAVDFAWDATGGGNQVTIQPGQSVSFGYPSGSSDHNADFATGPQPSSCVQSTGTSSGAVPPLPHSPTAPGWTGSCTFNTPGTYTFHCDMHPQMTGTIMVQGQGTTTTSNPPPTTGPTTTATTTTTTTTTTQSPPRPATTPVRISISHQQHGRRISGAVTVPAGYARGSLEVDVYSGPARVGRLVRRGLSAGVSRFSVPLRGHHRRRLTVVVFVKATHQPTRSARVSVLTRGA